MVLFSRFYYLVVFRGTRKGAPFFVEWDFDYFIINTIFTFDIPGI